MKVLICICARGGSKGIPGKNIKPVNGIPLIGLSIKMAQQFAKGRKIHIGLSTDDADIKSTAHAFGLNTKYERPAQLATDSAGKLGTIKDLLLFEEDRLDTRFDLVLDLDVTSPLRTCEDLEVAMNKLLDHPTAVNIFSVNKAHRNPYFNMVEEQRDGFYGLVKQPESTIFSRQATPKVYDLNASFYFYTRDFFEAGYMSPITDKSLIYEMPHICFDLDEPIDYEFLTYLMKENKLGFELGI